MSRLKRILLRSLRALGVVVLLVFVVGSVLTVVSGRRYEHEVKKIAARGEPVSLAELAKVSVPDDENAAVIFQPIFTRIQKPKLELDETVLTKITEESKPGSTAEEWSAAIKMAPKFDWLTPKVAEAVDRPHCKFAVDWRKGYEAPLPHYAHLRKIARILSAKALIYARQGKMDESVRCVKLAEQIADAIGEDPLLVGVLVRASISRLSAQTARGLLREGNLTAGQARELYAIFEGVDFTPQLMKSMESERACAMYFVEQTRANGPLWAMGIVQGVVRSNGSPGGRRSALLGILARPLIYEEGTVCLRAMDRVTAKLAAPYREVGELSFSEDLLGIPRYAILTRALMPAFSSIRRTLDASQAEISVTQVALAAAAYRDTHGAYPRTLAELQSSFGELPEDPLSGKPFRYTAKGGGCTIYSIGQNLKDDGGRRDDLTADGKYRQRKAAPDDIVCTLGM